jgi:hypothetical protein
LAFVTQNGWDINVVNEVGLPSRAWIDYPGHIWVQSWNEGAIYSSDGMTIQFDRGVVWLLPSGLRRKWWLSVRAGLSPMTRKWALTSGMTAYVVHVPELLSSF